MNLRKTIARCLFAIILVVVSSLLGLFVTAWNYHSEPIALAGMPPICSIVIDQIHYPAPLPETDDCKLRHWYVDNVKKISSNVLQMQEQSMSINDRAICAFAIRHQLRIVARNAMASSFEKSLLRVRDAITYRHFDGPEFTQMLGAHPDEVDYQRIFNSAVKTDAAANDICKL